MDKTVILLIQMAAIIVTARILGELMRAIRQPAVLGELTAGVLLGPSLFGKIYPHAYQTIFQDVDDLGKVGTLGLILLMLLTGLETDVRVLRNMGRAAFTASVFGMIVPFGSGWILTQFLDEHFILQKGEGRLFLSLFMATAMSISAMPVIAKILMDLKMIKRNIGIVTLTAAVVDDTVGWIALAVISGLVMQKEVHVNEIAILIGMLALFLTAARFILYPLLRIVLPLVDRYGQMTDGDLVLMVATGFLCAATTEAMHVHAVFGGFIAGTVLRQCPTLSAESTHRLEAVTLAIFAPLFFGLIGLRVDVWQLQNFNLLLIVIAVAVLGKVLGCYLGGILGKMPGWEALALGFCMSARGAMELVVAKIGLDLGILNGELFAIIVLMAIATSFLAPLLVRAVANMIPASDEEIKREKKDLGRFVQSGKLKILAPVSGGTNALIACHLAAYMCTSGNDQTTGLYVETAASSIWQNFLSYFGARPNLDLANYFEQIKKAAGSFTQRLSLKKVQSAGGVSKTILLEAGKGANFLFIGASGNRHPIYDPFLAELLQRSPCNVVVVADHRRRALARDGDMNLDGTGPFKNILVPINGSFVSDAAFDLAAHYAESSGARVTVLFVAELNRSTLLLPADSTDIPDEYMLESIRANLRSKFSERIKDPTKLSCHARTDYLVVAGIANEVRQNSFDLVVIGAENKSMVDRLYLGQRVEAALDQIRCTIAIVVPRVGAKLK